MSNLILGGVSQGGQIVHAIRAKLNQKLGGIFVLLSPPPCLLKDFPQAIKDTPTLFYQQEGDWAFDSKIAKFLTDPVVFGDNVYIQEKKPEKNHDYTPKMIKRLKQFIE